MSIKYISKLTSEPQQYINYILNDGSEIEFLFEFRINTNHWFIDIRYGDLIINNIMLVATLDLLKQFNRILPFKIIVGSETGLEPLTQDCFKNGDNYIGIDDYTEK